MTPRTGAPGGWLTDPLTSAINWSYICSRLLRLHHNALLKRDAETLGPARNWLDAAAGAVANRRLEKFCRRCCTSSPSIIYPADGAEDRPQIKFSWSSETLPENYSVAKASHMPTLEIDCEKLINSLISGRTPLASGPCLLLERKQRIYSSTYSLAMYNLNFYRPLRFLEADI